MVTHDLSTAAGYQAWRDAGGLWPDETPERMQVWREAQTKALAAEVDLSEAAA